MSEDLKPFRYEPIALSNESTVVAEFVPDFQGVREVAYQSEAELEKAFIKQLQVQAYGYLPITSEAELIANVRRQLEKLNKITFSDTEWERFFSTCIAGANDGLVEKTTRIQEDHIQVLKRDDGSIKNIYLLDNPRGHRARDQCQPQLAQQERPHRAVRRFRLHQDQGGYAVASLRGGPQGRGTGAHHCR